MTNNDGAPSLCCLPAMIKEIDQLGRKPCIASRAAMLRRYKRIELDSCAKSDRSQAPDMVNDYLIEVLWRTRKYRNG